MSRNTEGIFSQSRFVGLCTLMAVFLSGCSDGIDQTPTAAIMAEDGASQAVQIIINHAYKPNLIEAKAGVPLEMTFHRKESTESCARDLQVPVAGFDGRVPNGEKVVVHVTAQEAGEYPFHCSMKMMNGLIRFR